MITRNLALLRAKLSHQSDLDPIIRLCMTQKSFTFQLASSINNRPVQIGHSIL